jgi:hypothetical protein
MNFLLVKQRWLSVAMIVAFFAMSAAVFTPSMTHAMVVDGAMMEDCGVNGCVDEAPSEAEQACAEHCLKMQNEQTEDWVIVNSDQFIILEKQRVAFDTAAYRIEPARGSPDHGQRSRHLSMQKKE